MPTREEQVTRRADELIARLEDEGVAFELNAMPAALPQVVDVRLMMAVPLALLAGCIVGAILVEDGAAQRIFAAGGALVAILTGIVVVLAIARTQGVKTKEIVDVLKELRNLVGEAVPNRQDHGKEKA
jgi:hypothetical protein